MEGLIEKSINDVYVGKSWIESFEKEKIVSPMIIEILKKSYNKKSLDLVETAMLYLDVEIEKELRKAINNMEKMSYIIIGISLLIFGIFVLIPCIELFMGGFIFI
jgi:type II secretory pathway component PulF